MLLKRIARQVLAAFCICVLLGTGLMDTGYADVKIGEKTSWKTYIKAEDWPKRPNIESASAVLIDAQSGAVLYARNPDTLRYPASITKIMTALLTLENCDLKDKMTFTEEATQDLPYNSVAIYATEGERMSIEACLNACLVYSANDAASGLACQISGNLKDFAKLMNQRAKELGCKNTHFNNPHGLSDDEHWTTAYDMCQIMKECIKHEKFREIASTRLYTLKKNNKRKEAFTFAAKHKMLFPSSPYYYENIVCGKTGYTKEAVNTLITYAEKDGRGLIVCCMKAGYGVAYTDTKTLFEYGFNKFKNVDAVEKSEPLMLSQDGSIQTVEEAAATDTATELFQGNPLEMVGAGILTLPKSARFDQLTTELEAFEEKDEEDCFGRLVYKYEDTEVGAVKLKMTETSGPQEAEAVEDQRSGESGGLIKEANENNISSRVQKYMDEILQGKHQEVVFSVAGVVALILFLIIVSMISSHNRKKKYQGHSYLNNGK